MEKLLVNVTDWEGPLDGKGPIQDGWLIANAPRPLLGERAWQAAFRHGIFYAAAPVPAGWDPGQVNRWGADDGWLVEFITDEQIAQRCAAHAREYGYASLADAAEEGITVADIAAGMGLPYRGAS